MRKLCQLALVIMAVCAHAWATTYTVNNGQTTSFIKGVISGTVPGDTVVFTGGTYNIDSSISPKCGVTYIGPTVALNSKNQVTATAILNGASLGSRGVLFQFGSQTCTQPTVIKYLAFSGAGVAMHFAAPFQNVTIQYDNFNSIPCDGGCTSGVTTAAILMDGSSPLNYLNNFTIQYNTIGDSNSCAGQFTLEDTASCSGWITFGSLNNFTVVYNNFFHVGESIHIACPDYNSPPPNHQSCEPAPNGGPNGGAVMTNIVIRYNDFNNIKRIPVEIQPQQSSGLVVQYNSEHDYLGADEGSFGYSFACCSNGIHQNPNPVATDNLLTMNTPYRAGTSRYGYAIEGMGYGQTNSHNMLQNCGITCQGALALTWDNGGTPALPNSQYDYTYNYICGIWKNNGVQQYIGSEGNYGSNFYVPTQTGLNGQTSCSQTASFAPTISPPPGAQAYPLTVILTDSGYTSNTVALARGNTGIWYTTDGSTPVPGSGTAKRLDSGGSFMLSAPATVKAVGMWGAANQPTSYQSGLGFGPSSVVTSTFTAGTTFDCPSFTTTNTPCGVGGLISGSGNAFKVIGSTNGATPAVSGGNVVIAQGGINHFALSMVYQTPVNVQGFTTTWKFIPSGENIAFTFNNCANNGASGVGTCDGFALANFSSGASCEGGFSQSASGNPVPYNVFALMLDQQGRLAAGDGSFTYSNVQIYQQNQSPCNPSSIVGPIIPYWSTTKFSTSPVALNSPAGTNGTTTGHTYSATLGYDGSTVSMCMYDVTAANGSCSSSTSGTGTFYQHSWQNVSIPSQVNGVTGYVGITGSSGGASAGPLTVTSWTYATAAPTATPSSTVTAAGSPTATNPTFSPVPGTYSGAQSVTMTCPGGQNGVYTLTTPDLILTPLANQLGGAAVGTPYSGPITVSATSTLFGVCGLNGTGTSSGVVQGNYVIGSTSPAATPVFTPGSESFFVSASVSISTTTPGATIYYTTDGTTPTTASLVYSSPITVTATTTIKAMAAASGFSNSAIGSATYTLSTPPLTGCNQQNAGSINTIIPGTKVQQFAQCVYAATSETLNCSPGADKYGNVATVWGASAGAITVGTTGNPAGCSGVLNGPGCVTGISGGNANSTLSVGSHVCSPWGWMVIANPILFPPATPKGLSGRAR